MEVLLRMIGCGVLTAGILEGFSEQEYWSGLPVSPPVEHILSEFQYDPSILGGPAWHGS